MSEQDRPEIDPNELDKPVSGKDLPPLELMPDRQWLHAKITEVEYRVSMFNNQVQYVTKKEFDETENKEVDVHILDNEGNKIPRKEFAITFTMHDYTLPNKEPRKCWLQMGASLGENAHLPTFLGNTCGWDNELQTPTEIINALKGMEVRLQLKNKPRKDKNKPPYQQVIYDAVECVSAPEKVEEPEPITPEEAEGEGWPE